MKFFLKQVWFPCLLVLVCSCSETQNGTDDPADLANETNNDADSTIQTFVSTEPSNHRVAAEACDNSRPSLPIVTVREPEAQPCASHSDCVDGANGRCSYYPGPGGESESLGCTYDKCFTDGDCKSDEVCRCGNDIHADNRLSTDENRCVPSNCKTDVDCSAGNWCKASPSFCGDGIIVGYFCTTDEDECRDDTDCGRAVCDFPFYDGINRYICEGADCD